MKFYAVKTGRKTGIFESWDECCKSVKGYSGAVFKSFQTRSEASRYLEDMAQPQEEKTEAEPDSACPVFHSDETEASERSTAEDEILSNIDPAGTIDPPGKPDRTGSAPSAEEGLSRSRGREAGRPDGFVLAESAKAYVDGSYLEATGEFSYGCILLYGDVEIRFYEKMSDPELAAMHNVAGEIKGAEAAMRFAIANGIRSLTIYHDYEGIARWCTGEWTPKKKGTIAYSNFYQSLPDNLRVRFVKVRGHSGDVYNELADRLAKFALGIQD